LTVTFEFLINEALLQPQVFVHRDFHSRNLMVLPPDRKDARGPGVIDFQDALRGPVGYDLVSLLKDCYISWSRERVERWVKGYRRVLGNLGADVGDSEYQFLRWFDLIGVQRHLKVLGIFARLWHRDGKIGYLDDLPLVMGYVLDACRRYPELVEFGRWLEWRVAPQLAPAILKEKEKAARKAAAAVLRAKKRKAPKRKAKAPEAKRRAKPKVKPRTKVKPRLKTKAKAKANAKSKVKTRVRAKPKTTLKRKSKAKAARRTRIESKTKRSVKRKVVRRAPQGRRKNPRTRRGRVRASRRRLPRRKPK
jgi:hypothetical protein